MAEYNWNDEQNIVRTMQQCQRNWDYSKTIPEHIVNELVWLAQNAPSKQHEAYYDVYYTTDRNVIQELYQYTWGHTQSRNPASIVRNSQMNANMYMLFVGKQPPTMENTTNDGKDYKKDSPERWGNAVVSIGMALSLVMSHAVKNGLVTGCNLNNSTGPDCNHYWEKRLGLYDDVVVNNTKRILYGVGIGYAQEGRPRWEMDDTELCIGAGNGNGITQLDPNDPNFVEINPLNNEPYRRCKIVDITQQTEAVDPYGDVHVMPASLKCRPHSHEDRDIKCIEIL